MANQEQLRIFDQGVERWNTWREDNPNIEVDLSEVDFSEIDLGEINLSKAKLFGTNLSEVNLNGADLSDAILIRTEFIGTKLVEANLSGAYFGGTDLSGANLSNANLRGAEFNGANFSEAILSFSDFMGCFMGDIIFGDNDLSTCIGLETIMHSYPSVISTKTIQRSKGKIPICFLHGCGLSDLDVEYTKLATPGLDSEQIADITAKIQQLYLGEGVHYYSCFVSYNVNDRDFAQRLHDDLQDDGVRCWFAPEDMKIGDKIRPTIDRQIRLRDKLLVILSENSVQSEWVGDEVEAAVEEEKTSGRLVLFPIRLDDAVMETRDDWAAKIRRRRHIGDFSNWKDEGSYRKAFERLLRNLKTTV